MGIKVTNPFFGVVELGWWTIFTFHLALLISVASYLSDVGSDLGLAGRYYTQHDFGWAIFTTAFIVVPWILQLFAGYKFLKGDWGVSASPTFIESF